MTEYRRPPLDYRVFRDPDGEVIPYGHRWAGSPPGDTYSQTHDLERFAPVTAVADALIAWLEATFDVDVVDHPSVAADLWSAPAGVTRAVRLVPRDPAAAPLTIVEADFPGVRMVAGTLGDAAWPVCGCDACDEDIAGLIGELEWTVRTVVDGGLEELVHPDGSGRYRLTGEGRMRASGREAPNPIAADRASMRPRPPSGGQWQPWRRREPPA